MKNVKQIKSFYKLEKTESSNSARKKNSDVFIRQNAKQLNPTETQWNTALKERNYKYAYDSGTNASIAAYQNIVPRKMNKPLEKCVLATDQQKIEEEGKENIRNRNPVVYRTYTIGRGPNERELTTGCLVRKINEDSSGHQESLDDKILYSSHSLQGLDLCGLTIKIRDIM